jgi:hypothetical protein
MRRNLADRNGECSDSGSKSAIKFHDFPIDVPRQRQVDNSLARKKLNWVPQVF